jgi:adenylate cyclase
VQSNHFTASDFGRTVREDYVRRGLVASGMVEKSMSHGSGGNILETRSLGHPDFAGLAIGEQRTANIACVFLDLSNFTGRTFWDSAYETARLANAVSTGFIAAVSWFGGFPLGLRGDGLFAGFGPGTATVDVLAALGASALALQGVENEVNPWLKAQGKEPIQARAGADFGEVTFVRSGSQQSSEVNQIGFAANFAAKCEKSADAWEIVIGEGMSAHVHDQNLLTQHEDSPKKYTRNYKSEYYRFYDYAWRRGLSVVTSAGEQIAGTPTTKIRIG